LSNNDIIETVWATIKYYKSTFTKPHLQYEKILGECVNNVLKRALIQKSEDNITAIMVCFKNLLV